MVYALSTITIRKRNNAKQILKLDDTALYLVVKLGDTVY